METASGNMNLHIVPQLKADNFNNWKFRVKALLDEKQVKDALEININDIIDEEEREEFVKRDAKARNTIVRCITDKHLDLIKDAKTAQDMITALDNVFERKSTFTKLTLRRKLLTLKCNKDTKLEDHFIKFDTIIRELESVGSKVDETDKVCYLLLSLNDDYEGVITAIETMNADIDMEFVKAKLLDQELKIRNKASNNDENVATSFKAAQIVCYKCGKKGHKSFECLTKDVNIKYNEKRNYHGKLNRGRGRGRGYHSHSQKVNEADSEVSFIALSCKTENLDNKTFIIDSGATQHLVSEKMEDEMDNIKDLLQEVVIHVANGEKMIAKKKGTYYGICQGRKLNIPALIVKGMKHNLLSVSQLTKKGHEVIFQDDKVKIKGNDFEIFCKKINNLYTMTIDVPSNALHSYQDKDLTLWHRRLGHLNYEGLKILGLPFSKQKCPKCLEGKSTRRPFVSLHKRTSHIGELIHSNVCGPINPQRFNGEKYF